MERARGAAPRRLGGLLIALLGGLVLLAPAGRAGEPQRVEVVGVHAIRDGERGRGNPRDEAIQRALWEGVSQVALELIGEAPEAASDAGEAAALPGAAPAKTEKAPDPTARFRKILGRQVLPYTRSFRIVEDRGERPVLFADEPGVRSEYLVVVEVLVDVDRLEAELARAGLVEQPVRPGGGGETVTIELVGLEQYAGLRRVIETLRRELGATRVETLEFSPARQLLRVESRFGPDEVAARLGRADAADLILDPVEVDREGRRLRVLTQWFPPAPPDESTPEATGLPTPPAARR